MENLKGLYTALVTPFTPGGSIDEGALQALVQRQISHGIHGFYVCGSTGEAFLLSTQERQQILEIVAREAAGKAKIIAHIGAISQDIAITLAEHARKVGVDAISSIPPFYYGFSFEEIKSYYYGIVEAVEVPMIVYNFPGNSGVTITPERMADFLSDPRFIGVKHTSSDFFAMERFLANFPETLVFNGFDEMLLSGLAMGASGGVGSTYNIMAKEYVLLYEFFQQGKMREARALQSKINDVIEILLEVGVMPGIKAALTWQGIPFGECRKPFRQLTKEDKKKLFSALEQVRVE